MITKSWQLDCRGNREIKVIYITYRFPRQKLAKFFKLLFNHLLEND